MKWAHQKQAARSLRRACLALAGGAFICAAAAPAFSAPKDAKEDKLTSGGDVMTPPKPDKPSQRILDKLAALGAKPIETLTPEEARKGPSPADAVVALLTEDKKSTESMPESKVKTEDRTFSGPGGDTPIRIYTPPDAGSGPLPVLVYFHGGGWVIADLNTYDASARGLAAGANCIVVSSHYRQAPEHKFPAALEDAAAAWIWVTQNAASFGGDPNKMAIAGESAGGNLATEVAMLAKPKGLRAPVHQLLVYPVTQYGDFDTPSYKENAAAKPLSKDMMKWFWGHYLPTPEDGKKVEASPLNATEAQLKGMAPATVILAEIDPLRSEGEEYAKKLKAAGVDVTVKHYKGVTHEFFGAGAIEPKAKEAMEEATSALKKAFAKAGGGKNKPS